ncbi:lectin C-type domain protein [Necator americanus]|uniref:Lectin C-type domain protein n=1 Tax=Necator americanus TaxID=51031 RepID=W2TI19_NECAM|nr:lectin C-type domain protein [Necator americanus]ETN81229.1 lectin C-type domain protein [Necator americanus]
MLVFESTEATSQTGLQEMLAHVQSSLYDFNIKPSTSNEQLCTRIGIVVYGLTSVLYAPLGSLSRDEFLAIDSLPYFGDQIPNLEDAGGVFGSGQIAAQFKEDNGVLVVYNYVEQHGFPELKLERLASPGYFLTNIEDNSSINRALCDGCYSVKQASTSYQLAANQCRNEDGCVALAKQRNQTDYLEKKFTFGSSFWIGLKWDQFKQNYVWADGTELNGSAQPWASSSDHQNGIDCVRVVPQSAELVWTPVDCRDSFAYSCEVAPCDSQIFCTQDV